MLLLQQVLLSSDSRRSWRLACPQLQMVSTPSWRKLASRLHWNGLVWDDPKMANSTWKMMINECKHWDFNILGVGRSRKTKCWVCSYFLQNINASIHCTSIFVFRIYLASWLHHLRTCFGTGLKPIRKRRGLVLAHNYDPQHWYYWWWIVNKPVIG